MDLVKELAPVRWAGKEAVITIGVAKFALLAKGQGGRGHVKQDPDPGGPFTWSCALAVWPLG